MYWIQDACWVLFLIFLMCESVKVVALFRLVPIAAGIGLYLMGSQISRYDYRRLIIFLYLNVAVLLAVIQSGRYEILLFSFVRAFLVPFYVIVYLSQRGIRRQTLIVIALSVLPQLFVYFTGITFSDYQPYTFALQFCGLAGDPNYLSSYLVISLGAQLALLREPESRVNLFIWIIMAFITVFLILISVSRAGTMAMILSLVIFAFSFKYKNPYRQFLIISAILYATINMSPFVLEQASSDSIFSKLYNRFTVEGDSSLQENSRYGVMERGFKQIFQRGPIEYTDESIILAQEGTLIHNTLIRLGISYGWLSAITHIIVWVLGLLSLIILFIREFFLYKKYAYHVNMALLPVMLLVLPYFFVIMSIPALEQNLYWAQFGMIFTFFSNKKSSLYNYKNV
ncbi:MAG: hypothetical protein JZU65_19895 [Chlorobium sp.]|uniref:Uncharacterized protein n=2 Tax=Pelodictyon phaeoclathratiforme TaxID=34090 RepID=B4SDC8_PELPB|nr:hypothetical protein Ppha_0554 [Pelodictyon phaeoclathratiforme BU-1]MBV5329859.1 hypothetical protein [Chlorobium sp.]